MITIKYDYNGTLIDPILASKSVLTKSNFIFEFDLSDYHIPEGLSVQQSIIYSIEHFIRDDAIIFSNDSDLDNLLIELIQARKQKTHIITLRYPDESDLSTINSALSEILPKTLGIFSIDEKIYNSAFVTSRAFVEYKNTKKQIVFLSTLFKLNGNNMCAEFNLKHLPYFKLCPFITQRRLLPSVIFPVVPNILRAGLSDNADIKTVILNAFDRSNTYHGINFEYDNRLKIPIIEAENSISYQNVSALTLA